MDSLKAWAERDECRIAWGSLTHLAHVQAELARRHSAGAFDEEFFQRSLTKFRYLSGAGPRPVKSVGVVAMPRPAHRVKFSTAGGVVEALLPPTYVHFDQISQRIHASLNTLRPDPTSHFAPLHAPLKALAVSLGLARYGRNNLTYVEGLGSYHQLIGFATDLELDVERPPEPTAVLSAPQCDRCEACRRACPTGAISDDRFLLRGERCLTFFNEYEEPWPAWLPPSAHNCLVGCLLCQEACPYNAGLFRIEDAAEVFSVEETQALLDGSAARSGVAGEALRAKLVRLGLEGYEPIFGRNLRALLRADRRG